MATRRRKDADDPPLRPRPATTPEDRENQIIAAAMDLVEKRILDGSATSQEVTHFLKMGSPRERLERTRLAKENQLLEAKIGAIESQAKIEELYQGAITAMRSYGGQEEEVYEEDQFDD